MKERGFLWCPHCGSPHPLRTLVCPTSSKPLEAGVHKQEGRTLAGKVVAEKYRVIRHLGQGGMCDVFEAENIVLKRRVALKVVKPKAGKEVAVRLEREAQLVAAANHPNICDVYDAGRMADGTPFLVLEFLMGQTLAERLKQSGPLPLSTAYDLFTQILSGLHAAHGASIIHRDLKPQNVFLAERVGCPPVAKVMDFGLAKDLSGARGKTITAHGHTVGTKSYMAPEQLRGERLDIRADIFAVGITLFEVLTMRHPFGGESAAEVHANILRAAPLKLADVRPDLPPAIAQVIGQALSKARDDRFATALAMQTALRHAMRG